MTLRRFEKATVASVVQLGSRFADHQAALHDLDVACAECAAQGSQIAVFPEALIGGYPKGLVFGASLGIRTPEGRQMFRAYADAAIEVPGPVCDEIGKIARKHKMYLVIGIVERSGGTLYCSAIYMGPGGQLLGKHRKLMPTAIERLVWGSGDGSTLDSIDSPIGRFGALICWENYMPLARMAMYQQGIQLYCTPTVDDRDAWIPTLRHIAREGRCFVLSSCQYLTREDYPKDWLPTAQHLQQVPIRGGSCIVDPLGEIIAGPIYDRKAVLTMSFDLDRLMEAKFDFDVVGHYARPDVFRFRVKSDRENDAIL